MAEEKKWKKWEGPEKPEGKGGIGGQASSQSEEVEGRKRHMLVICWNCGSGNYVETDVDWFACWKCGAVFYQ